METKRTITVENTIEFFGSSSNSIEDALGIAYIDKKSKIINLDFNSVLLLRINDIFADTNYPITYHYFDTPFKELLNRISSDVLTESSEYSYTRNLKDQTFTFTIKVEDNDTHIKLYIICYEKLFETEEQLLLFSNVVGSGMSMFEGSTWFIDYDKHSDYFFQSDTGPRILGMPISEEKKYYTPDFQKVRDNVGIVSPFYDECIKMEGLSFEAVRHNKTDYFGGRTPALTKDEKVVWVEAYGKCLIRYKDGRPRFFIAIDIYLSDVFENNNQLKTLNTLIDYGLINADVGVWYYQKHFLEGRYYFTKSHYNLMSKNQDKDYGHDTIIDVLDTHTQKIIEANPSYKKYYDNFRLTHRRIFSEGLDKYALTIPNHSDPHEPQWIEVRGRVIERDKNGEITLFVGVNVDITESFLRNQELEHLRIQNERLQLAEKLAVKAGSLLVWYQDSSLIGDMKYFFANEMFSDKLGIERRSDGLYHIEDIYKTLDISTNESQLYSERIRQELRDLYSKKNNSFKNILAAHVNIHNGNKMFFNHSVEIEEYNDDGSIKLIGGIMVDVTTDIKRQKEIEYLANYDTLTNCHNRNYFDKFIEENLPPVYSILIFDVDGLKLINDAFGHMKGDNVIRTLASFLQTVFEDNLIIARIGGDEFVVIVKEINEKVITSTANYMETLIEEYNKNNHIKINVSKGGKSVNNDLTFEKAFTQAENLMYRRKLNNRSSRKSKVLESILETLNQKTEETKEHSDRLSIHAVETLIGLGRHRASDIEDIELLARVHDIGKITIPDIILGKPGKLTDDEYEIIKRHSEAGYKITKNITDSDEVSNGVLCHHEHYDGNGYPQGLKGEEIPLFARIISVVDAYDAMTSIRVYQSARTKEDAIAELRRCSGTQFDPVIVEAFIKASLK